MAPMLQSPEIQFAQRLASNEKPIRTRAVKKLRKYLSIRSQKPTGGFSNDELLKIWKGLFYCMWMQDKPLLQRAYAAEAQATRLANAASVLTAHLDCVLREAPIPEPVAAELRLLSSTLLQISGLQGQALDRSLDSLIVAHRQLWLSQARVPDADKAALLDMPISPGHTFGPAVEEILQSSHREHKESRQVAALRPPRAPAYRVDRAAGELFRLELSPEQSQSPRLRWVT
ncbi:UNVERIFIED_CONTAM: hypothetical protein FKN15_020044 [Acipenser sinensis]